MNATTRDSNSIKKFEPSHFAYIDAVRGLAFLAVLSIHVALSVGPFRGRLILAQGGLGVQLFFLASAITLCHSMAARQKVDRHPVLYFYLRRLFRIAPLFWMAMIFYWTFPSLAFGLAQWAPWGGVHASYFIVTALFLHGWHPYTFNSIVPGGWSIAVEMSFYVLFPFIYKYLGHSVKRTTVAVLFSILYLRIMDNHADPWLRQHFFAMIPDNIWDFFIQLWFPSQLPVFLIGFLAYHLIFNSSIAALMKNRFWAGSLFIFLSMVLFSFLRVPTGGFIPNFMFLILTLAGIIMTMSGRSLPGLVNPFFCYLGKISYSCYLVHFAALAFTLKWVNAGLPFSNLWLFAKIFTITLAFTMMISTITVHLVENPGIALGRKLIQRINRSSLIK